MLHSRVRVWWYSRADRKGATGPSPTPTSVVCPGHGAMTQWCYLGVVIVVRCDTCGKRPLDLLSHLHLPGTRRGRSS